MKLGEDLESLLCQIVDDLGHSDAVINVRGGPDATPDYAELYGDMEALSRRLPVRYIDF